MEFDKKEQLIEEAKKLAENPEEAGAARAAANLARQWRESDEESLYEKELKDKFDSLLDVVFAKAGDAHASAESAKKEIIAKAKEALNNKNFKAATATMNELMSSWKAAGRANKEVDDALWAEFSAVRDEFYANKKAFFENLSASIEANKAGKEALIKEAEEALKNDNIKELTEAMNGLMDKWKTLGNAGKENDELWAKFSAVRKQANEKRTAHYNNLRETYAKRVEEKKALIAEVKKNLALSEFTEEETKAVTDLRAKWKAVGHAGKDNEEALWEEFNRLVNKYFENRKFYKN